MQHHIPDEVKVAVSVSPPALSFLGIPLQEWTYILSAVVSLIFIIEKSPIVYERLRGWWRKVKNVKRKE